LWLHPLTSEALIEDGIRVNAVARVRLTPLIPASFEPDHVAKHGSSVPMKRAGQPNEVEPCYVLLRARMLPT
jgi:NAD(P)-dependent dehydrogenase (short-subunit alcohol dehydrogenase family)